MVNREEEYTEDFLEDQELLRRHREGDSRAFGQLFSKHHQLATRYARKYAVSSDQVEDLVLEAFTRILATIKRGRGPTISMGHYLVSTIRSVAVSGTSYDSKEYVRDPLEVGQLYENEQFADQAETSEWLTEAFNTLSDRSQSVVWFRVVENMPSREIASTLGVSAATITREYQAAMGQMREQFVNFSVAEARDPVCREYAPLLRKFAKRRGSKSALAQDDSFNLHVAGCERCSGIVSRLKASDRVLMSVVFVSGLGGLAKASLETAPAAAIDPLFSSLSAPLKLALTAIPIVGVAAIVVGVLSFSATKSASTAISIGHVGDGQSTTIVQVGNCQLTREPLDEKSEAWRLSSDAEGCGVRISFLPMENGQDQALEVLDTSAKPDLRVLEVTQPGSYSVTVTDGVDTKQETVEVRP